MTTTILKPYERRREPGPITRFLLGALLVFVAMIYGLMTAVLPPQMLSWPLTPILIMIGLILWLLPDIGGVHYASLQRFMLAYIGLSVFWPAYIAFNLPGLPWISFQRIALFFALSVFVWNYSTSREMRAAIADAVSETPILIRFFWGFWLATTISVVFGTPMSVSISKYVNNQIYWTMTLFLIAFLATRPGFVMKASRIIVIASIMVIPFGILELVNQRVPWIDYLPGFLRIDPELIETLMSSQARAGTNMYRVRGPYPTALYFSEILTMYFPFFLHFTATERRPLPFLLLLAGTYGMCVLMYVTGARSAMIGLTLAVVLYAFYQALRVRTLAPRSLVSSVVVFAYPAALVLLALVVQFWQRAHVMLLGGGQHQASSNARSDQWAMAWPKLFSHPLGFGVGRGNAALGYATSGGEATVDSYYITIMMDSGLLALPLFLVIFLVPAYLAFHYFRTAETPEQQLLAPLSLGLINFVIVKSVLSSEGSMSTGFVFVGCVIGLVWQRRRAAKTATAAPAPTPPPRSEVTRNWQGVAVGRATPLTALPRADRTA